MSKNSREGKGREGKEEFGLAFSPIRGAKWGRVIITIFCTRGNAAYVMTCTNLCVDIARERGSGGG